MTRPQLEQTSRGLGFHHAKLLAYMIALPVMVVCNLVVSVVFASGARDVVAFFGIVGMVASYCFGFLSPALGVTGSALCCRAPSRAGGRPLVIASLALDATALMFLLVSIRSAAASSPFRGFGTASVATVLSLALFTTAFLWTGAALILFVLFLRKLAHLLDDVGMASEAREIIVHYGYLLIAAPTIAGAALGLLFYFREDYASAYDFACEVFAPQVDWVETLERGVGVTFTIALGIWLAFVIKLLFRMMTLISSMRYTLRARYGV